MPRRFSHLLVLALLLGLPTLASFGLPALQRPPAQLLGGGLSTARAAEEIQPPAMAPVQAAPGGSVAQTAGSRVAPVRPAPTYLQAFRPTTFWSSERPEAMNLGVLPQWTVLRQLGTHVGSRLPVEYPGDGLARLPQRGWVDGIDLGPGARPSPDFELAAGGDISPTTGVRVPLRSVQSWPRGITAQYAALVDGDSGEVLWGRNANGQVAPASLTKIVTSLVALERSRLADRVNIQVDSRNMWDSTVMGLTPGENLAMETLLYGLMLSSGNDAGLAIAQHVAGSETAFSALMNAKVAEHGLVNSRFVNSHGLDAAGHYSSPFDLAALARAGMQDPAFARLVGARRFEAEGYVMVNLNRLIGAYPKADGVKVGYTDAAGRAIVASATEGGHRVFAALIRSANPTAEAEALLEWAFRGFVW